MHTFSNAGGNVTWDLGGEIYWDSSSQALLGADCLSSQADYTQLALQCKLHSQALVCLASGLFDRLHVLLNISSDAHFRSTVNISLGFCLKIRSLKIPSFNKKSSCQWTQLQMCGTWLSGLLTSDHEAASPLANLHIGSQQLAAEESKRAATFLFLLLSKRLLVHCKSTCEAQPELSDTHLDSYASLTICSVASTTKYTYIHTHTCVRMHTEFTTAAFWKKLLQLFFLWCCVEISERSSSKLLLRVAAHSERQEGFTSLHPLLNFTKHESAEWVICESLSTQQGHQPVHTVQSTTTFSFAALPDRWHVICWYQTSEALIPCVMQSDTQRLSGHAAQHILHVFL